MTIGEFSHCIDGYKNLIEREMKQQDHLNHILGNYIAIGVNNPKKYPKEPLLAEKRETVTYTTDQQRLAAVRIKYGKK